MTEEQKIFLKECLIKLPAKFWEDEDHAVGGYISKEELYRILSEQV